MCRTCGCTLLKSIKQNFRVPSAPTRHYFSSASAPSKKQHCLPSVCVFVKNNKQLFFTCQLLAFSLLLRSFHVVPLLPPTGLCSSCYTIQLYAQPTTALLCNEPRTLSQKKIMFLKQNKRPPPSKQLKSSPKKVAKQLVSTHFTLYTAPYTCILCHTLC